MTRVYAAGGLELDAGTPVFVVVTPAGDTIAVDDMPAAIAAFAASNVDVTGNDTLTEAGVYTFQASNLSGCTIAATLTGGIFAVTPTLCTFSFDYAVLLDGVPTGDTATVNGTATPGTYIGGNLFADPNFDTEPGVIVAPGGAIGAWRSDMFHVPQGNAGFAGNTSHPEDNVNTIVNGAFDDGIIETNTTFPGDAGDGIGATTRMWVENGQSQFGTYNSAYGGAGSSYRTLYQTVTGLTVGATYRLRIYGHDNLVLFGGVGPNFQWGVDGALIGARTTPPHPSANTWHEVGADFVATATSHRFEVWCDETNSFGNNFSLAAPTVRQVLTCP